jgi:hypothetical protein
LFRRRLGSQLAGVGVVAAMAAPLAVCTGASYGWLGSFEAADGYQPFLNMVQQYNAGQHGASSGYVAMSPVPIVANSGLWTAINGGFSSGGGISYATGHQFFDRTYVNTLGASGAQSDQGLVLTTGHEGWAGPALKYKYNVDAPDLGGVAPSSTGGRTIKVSFWNRGQLAGAEVGGQVPDGYFGNEVALQDSGGNVGFKLGLTQRASGDTITYWNGSTLLESSIVGSSSLYDRWDVTLDLAAGTFSASYFNFPTSTLYPFVTSAPLMSGMTDFTGLEFRSSPGTNNSKLWAVDDFSFVVRPIPGAPTVLAMLPGVIFAAKRRRRQG